MKHLRFWWKKSVTNEDPRSLKKSAVLPWTLFFRGTTLTFLCPYLPNWGPRRFFPSGVHIPAFRLGFRYQGPRVPWSRVSNSVAWSLCRHHPWDHFSKVAYATVSTLWTQGIAAVLLGYRQISRPLTCKSELRLKKRRVTCELGTGSSGTSKFRHKTLSLHILN